MTRPHAWIFMDHLKRKLFLKNEIKTRLLKSATRNLFLPIPYRYWSYFQKNKIIRWSLLPQVVNRCVRTGRAMSVTKPTRYSRFVFRSDSYKGNMPGFKRASW